MASAPGVPGLPMLYKDITPLSSQDHRSWKMRPMATLEILKGVHALPITCDEFPIAQRFFPVVFSTGPDSVPLALMGLNEGVNVYVDDEGNWKQGTYLPAFMRRYPFLLARLTQDAQELSLCFDPTANMLGEFEGEVRLFTDEGEPAQPVTDMLKFCEEFEFAAQRTTAFMKDLEESGLLEDGELTIGLQQEGSQPYTYRGFRMINETKLRDLRGDQLRKMQQSGMLTLIYAHLFSLGLTSEIFGRQAEQGKLPPQTPVA